MAARNVALLCFGFYVPFIFASRCYPCGMEEVLSGLVDGEPSIFPWWLFLVCFRFLFSFGVSPLAAPPAGHKSDAAAPRVMCFFCVSGSLFDLDLFLSFHIKLAFFICLGTFCLDISSSLLWSFRVWHE